MEISCVTRYISQRLVRILELAGSSGAGRVISKPVTFADENCKTNTYFFAPFYCSGQVIDNLLFGNISMQEATVISNCSKDSIVKLQFASQTLRWVSCFRVKTKLNLNLKLHSNFFTRLAFLLIKILNLAVEFYKEGTPTRPTTINIQTQHKQTPSVYKPL